MKILHLGIIAILSIVSSTAAYAEITSGSVLFMKSNSIGQIYANYTFRVLDNHTWNPLPGIFTGMSDSSAPKDLSIVANPSSITANKSNVPVTFTITAKNDVKGVYALFLFFCGESPLVVGLNESQVNPATLNQFFNAQYMCPTMSASTPDLNIVGYSGIISKTISTIPSDTNNVEIQNIQMQPPTIKVGDTFTINATLANNSPNSISLQRGVCEGPFSVILDSHVTVHQNQIMCPMMLMMQKLDPGQKTTGTSPGSSLTYRATAVGTVNATVTFSYGVWDQITHSNTWKTISKSFSFTISDNNTGTNKVNATVPSPLKQFKSGIAANDVKCQQDLQLVIKAEDGSPTCVKSQTAQKLVERKWGWAMQTIDSLKPLLPNRIPGLENDTGIITLENQTYYFETPNYTNTAYSNPVQISFHGVIFTLFPPGFRGGLPTGVGCGNVTPGEIVVGGGSYYWTDAKFSDGTHELLHIYADSQPCPVNSIPTDFSNHANPHAGLTFYDGKMKLLVSTDNQKLSYMNIKVYGSYTPSSLADHFLTGSLYSTAGPIQNGNITITVNGLVMGTTETYPNGCFQFNSWNDSKLADQINKSRSLGMSSTELNFQTQYFGDSQHNPVNASAGSYLGFYLVPLAPPQYDTSLYPSSEINVTQGNFTQFHVTVKPFSKYWEVQHMKLNLQRTPCGLSYHISPVGNNDSVLVNNTASFDVILNATSYTPSGKYWISIDQDVSGINDPSIGAEVGAFDLNVLKK